MKHPPLVDGWIFHCYCSEPWQRSQKVIIVTLHGPSPCAVMINHNADMHASSKRNMSHVRSTERVCYPSVIAGSAAPSESAQPSTESTSTVNFAVQPYRLKSAMHCQHYHEPWPSMLRAQLTACHLSHFCMRTLKDKITPSGHSLRHGCPLAISPFHALHMTTVKIKLYPRPVVSPHSSVQQHWTPPKVVLLALR
jgi:hypothetical protein